MNLAGRDLLGLEGLEREAIEMILDNASTFSEVLRRDVKKVPTLRGKSVITMFFENSTRTRSSFEAAGKYMSADVINISGNASSASKGESLRDTFLTLQALTADLVIMRTPFSGACHQAAAWVDIPVVNAGDGMHEHPTQGLLDALTIRDAKGSIEGLKVAIVGDVLHSRVARSNIWGLSTLGADVHHVLREAHVRLQRRQRHPHLGRVDNPDALRQLRRQLLDHLPGRDPLRHEDIHQFTVARRPDGQRCLFRALQRGEPIILCHAQRGRLPMAGPAGR